MSRRPKIVDRHEKAVEKEIQTAKKARDRGLKAAGKGVKTTRNAKPVVLSHSRGPVEGEVPKKVQEWIDQEAASQLRHYRRIFREQERLGPLRDGWVKEFFARITGPRGFSVHAGQRRTIPKNEVPKRPRRPWRVVW